VNGANVTPARLNASLTDAVVKDTFLSGKGTIPEVLDADSLFILDATDGVIKKVTRGNLLGLLNANVITGQTAETSVADDDVVLVYDTSATALRKVTRANLAPPVSAGTVIQTVLGVYSDSDVWTAVMPFDNTIPQVTEGTQVVSAAIIPQFSTSSIRVIFHGFVACVTPRTISVALFRNGEANAIAASNGTIAGSNYSMPVHIDFMHAPGAGTSTYTVRAGPNIATNFQFNGASGGRLYGGVAQATLTLQEIKG
jgi:hypothetical protein